MEFNRAGEGTVQIVLVPGGPGLTPEFYVELAEGLSHRAEVVTYTQRGSTPSDSTDFPRTLQEYAAELLEVAAAAASETPQVLLGHSFGVPVVLEALLENPGVDGAIFLNGFDSHEMFVRGMEECRKNLPPAFHASYDQLEIESLADLFPLLGEYFYPKHFCRLDPWPQSFLNALSSANMELFGYWLGADLFEANGAIKGWDRSGYLSHISVPTLVVSGRYDYYRDDDTRRLAADLPKGEVWISENASHTPWVEDPQRFSAVVQEFLRRLS